MVCWNCGVEIVGKTEVCPRCGARLDRVKAKAKVKEPSPAPGTGKRKKKANGYAIAGFVMSLLSIFLGLVFVTSVLGVVFSNRGAKNAKADGSGARLASAGTAISSIAIVFYIFAWFFIFI